MGFKKGQLARNPGREEQRRKERIGRKKHMDDTERRTKPDKPRGRGKA